MLDINRAGLELIKSFEGIPDARPQRFPGRSKAGGKVMNGLVARRAAEAKLLQTA